MTKEKLDNFIGVGMVIGLIILFSFVGYGCYKSQVNPTCGPAQFHEGEFVTIINTKEEGQIVSVWGGETGVWRYSIRLYGEQVKGIFGKRVIKDYHVETFYQYELAVSSRK